ncbi:MAG TPA: bifunctional transaldolase/phosoglucose isomerase [Ignavibacteriaceae bacterium]|nr:bifunctional transaldolase/phosoglucose isomerase [Ignavibacteriaceae bacterium]
MNPVIQLEKFGQSVWLDNINRLLITSGELENLIKNEGIRGITSNPTIFQKAIGKGNHYDEQIEEVLSKNPDISELELFEELAIQDIRNAADMLLPVYKSSQGKDGYISIEVSPELAYNTEVTISEARKLFKWIDRPNLMIKIPATKEGIPAIRKAISEGININVTLIFSPKSYEDVVEAYISGLEDRLKNNLDIQNIASVASFFISRIDTAVDKDLEAVGAKHLQGKIAIANAKLTYQKAKEIFNSERFKKLENAGAKVQRLLWASTGTKNPAYSDVLYVEELIGKDTVNTMPPDTILAYKDHGKPEDRIETNIDDARTQMNELKDLNIDFNKITNDLTIKGVDLFIDSFRDLLNTIKDKKALMLKLDMNVESSDEVKKKLEVKLYQWEKDNLIDRLFKKDFTLWKKDKKDDKELSNRLGWLNLPQEMLNKVGELKSFAEEIKKEYSHVAILGMGGSSLAPEVFFKTFGNKQGYPSLSVLDSTHPNAVNKLLQSLNLEKTLFVVSSKSGGTTETMSFFYTFYDALLKKNDNAGKNFIAITDPGSSLEKLAKDKNFKKILITPEEVGGRFSALTYFGLVPAALIGVDVELLLNRALPLYNKCKTTVQNSAFELGALLGSLSLEDVNKLTLVTSEGLSSLPNWIEQLIAESTGKEKKGILPVAGEELGNPDVYGKDRIFVYLKLKEENSAEINNHLKELKNKNYPVVTIELEDKYDIGKEFYRWEIATALAGSIMEINPFDQPNVQLAKTLANQAMKKYLETGKLEELTPIIDGDIKVYGEIKTKNIAEVIDDFLSSIKDHDYIAINAFIEMSEENEKLLNQVQNKLRNEFIVPVTLGFGPRFLHSTGQLHKGDNNSGLFIQFTDEIKNDVEVPGQGYSFGILVHAQADGDLNALKNTDRRTLRVHYKGALKDALKKLKLV